MRNKNTKVLANHKLKIGALNCHGLGDKVDQVNFLRLVENSDIFGLSETWLKENGEGDISITGYRFYHEPRKTNEGPVRGGVGVFIRNDLKKHVKIRRDISNENFL